jgi:hypothetical protein
VKACGYSLGAAFVGFLYISTVSKKLPHKPKQCKGMSRKPVTIYRTGVGIVYGNNRRSHVPAFRAVRLRCYVVHS